MSDLVGAIEKSIQKRKLFRLGQSIVIPVSGGLDSMVLLHVLHRLASAQRWRLTIAHLNHQLRGRSSDADERLVRRTAQRLRLPLVVKRADVRSLSRMEGVSLEMAARQARHEFLARAAAQSRAPSIALAHHADDQLELFFLRLLRGSGSDGLAGMKWRNPSPVDPKVQLVRPLLAQTKASLQRYAEDEGIVFREDATNASLDIQRNRVRHELLPLLRGKYQPALTEVISRVMDITSAEADLAREAASNWLKLNRKMPGPPRGRRKSAGSRDAVTVDKSSLVPFGELPLAVQRRALQAQLLASGVKPDFAVIEHLRLKPGKPVCVAQSQLVRGKAGEVFIFRDSSGLIHARQSGKAVFGTASASVPFQGRAGTVVFGGVRIHWRLQEGRIAGPIQRTPGEEVFDADRVGTPILLRHWLPGDRFEPIGMSCSVKLQDFLTNQKIPRHRRHELVLALTAEGELFWVEDLRISERFKLTPNTIRSLHWAWQKL